LIVVSDYDAFCWFAKDVHVYNIYFFCLEDEKFMMPVLEQSCDVLTKALLVGVELSCQFVLEHEFGSLGSSTVTLSFSTKTSFCSNYTTAISSILRQKEIRSRNNN
jgi:hypothetical protein